MGTCLKQLMVSRRLVIQSLVPIALSTFGTTCMAAGPCADLARYKKDQLAQEYAANYKKFLLNSKAKAELHHLRQDLLDQTDWALSDTGKLTGIVAQNLKSTCTVISGLLGFIPGVGVSGQVIDSRTFSSQEVCDLIKAGKTVNSIVSDGAEITAYKGLIAKGGSLGQAVKDTWEFAEDKTKLAALADNRGNLKAEVTALLDTIDAAIVEYERMVAADQKKVEEIRSIKAGIDKYLTDECRQVSGVWTGSFTYPAKNARDMKILFDGTGGNYKPYAFENGLDRPCRDALINGRDVSFTCGYGSIPKYYSGTISEDYKQMSGTWKHKAPLTHSGSWSMSLEEAK